MSKSSIITEREVRDPVAASDPVSGARAQDDLDRLAAVTSGELLLEDFLKPLGTTKYRLAKEIGIPTQRIRDIVARRQAVTADTYLRLCRFFGLSDGYWPRAQAAYDTEVARRTLQAELEKITPWAERLRGG